MKITEKRQWKTIEKTMKSNENPWQKMKNIFKKWKTLKKKTKPNDKPWKIIFKKMEKKNDEK